MSNFALVFKSPVCAVFPLNFFVSFSYPLCSCLLYFLKDSLINAVYRNLCFSF